MSLPPTPPFDANIFLPTGSDVSDVELVHASADAKVTLLNGKPKLVIVATYIYDAT